MSKATDLQDWDIWEAHLHNPARPYRTTADVVICVCQDCTRFRDGGRPGRIMEG